MITKSLDGMQGRGGRKCAAAAACLLAGMLAVCVPAAFAQGRPAVVWSEAGHAGAVTDVVHSPDGRLLATASVDETVKLWRYPEGDLVRTLVLPYALRDQVTDMPRVRFTPDGRHLVVAVNHVDGESHFSGDVHVFRVADGAPLRAFGRQAEGIAAIDLSPDGALVAMAGKRMGVTIWRFADGTLQQSLDPSGRAATDVDFSAAGDRLCAGYGDLHVASWRTSDWSRRWEVVAHADEITRTVFSNAGALVATTSIDGTARLLDADDGHELHALGVGTALRAALFSRDGATLATAGLDGRIRTWDVASGTLLRTFGDSGASMASLGDAQDGQVLVSGGAFPPRMQAWDFADGHRLRSLTRLTSGVDRVRFSPDAGRLAIAVSFDERVDVFDARTGARQYAWNTHARAEDVAFSPDGRLAAMPGADHTVVIRRLSDGRTIRTLAGHDEDVMGLAFSHDGALLASGSFFPGTIRLWRTSDWSLARVITGGEGLGAFGPFVSLVFSPDDTLLAASAEGAPLVIRVSDGTAVAHPQGISGSVVFSPDGALFAISGGVYLDEIRIFRVNDWSLAATLPTGATDITFTADGARLVAAQLDGLRTWRTSDWSLLRTYDEELGYLGDGQGVQSLALTPDAALLAYGRADATVVVARMPKPAGTGNADRADAAREVAK